MMLDTLRTDLRSTLRGLQKSRLYAIAAVSSLALSIAATVATFVLIEGLVLHSAPWQRPDEIFLLQRVDQKTGEVRATWSTPRFEDIRRATAGTIARKAVFVLPGSEHAVRLAMTRLILPELGHVVQQLDK